MLIFRIVAKKTFMIKVFLAIFYFVAVVGSISAQAANIVFNSPTQYNTVNQLTTGVVNWFLSVTAGVAMFFLIMGGIYYLTAFGDDKRMQEGKKIITYAVYGLLLILISYSIVTTINKIIFE